MKKPIKVFYSVLSNRFYASRAYKEEPNGFVTITGEKFDVTDDIGGLIQKHGVTFEQRHSEACGFALYGPPAICTCKARMEGRDDGK